MSFKNIGTGQQIFRFALAATVLVTGTWWVPTQPWRTALVVVGVALLVTAVSGWCPVATLLSFGAHPHSPRSERR